MVEVSGSSPLERIKSNVFMDVFHLIKKIIKKYPHSSFLIAYSGGLDSTVLLYKFVKIQKYFSNIHIRAIHINHNINSASQEWVIHCIQICQENNIELIVKSTKIDKNASNLEEKLRILRYNLIYSHLFCDEILVTGHHMNDQCETFFLSLKRGSGPNGLSGMSFESNFRNHKVIRPFLNKTKKELKIWANIHKIIWVEDFSNTNLLHDRNFIRHQVIPILKKRWPSFVKNCFRSTQICKKEINLKNILLEEKINFFLRSDYSLDISSFHKNNKEISQALIRHWIAHKNIKLPSYKVTESIYQQMIESKKDANPKIIIHNNEIRRYKNVLYFMKIQKIIKNTLLFWHSPKTKFILPNNLGILKQNIQGMQVPAPYKDELVNIRFQFEGKILILERQKKRKIKKIWQEKNIPPWLRSNIPLLFYNNHFISALGVFVVNHKNYRKKVWSISWFNDTKKKLKNN